MTVVRSGSATHVGRVRSVNQDLALETGDLFAVADGMGGHAGGEVAAQVAIDTIQSEFSHRRSIEGLQDAIVRANTAVWEEGHNKVALRGMGTTLTAAALVPGSDGDDLIAVANVGDSRAYVYSGGRVFQLTEDHSLAEEKVRQGELTEAEAAVHPHRHILTRALGVADDVEVDLWELQLRRGDRILLCSDGLTNEVAIGQIAAVLASRTDPTEAASLLVEAANEHGGNDNITVVVVDVLVGNDDSAGRTTVAQVVDGVVGVPVAINDLGGSDIIDVGAPSGSNGSGSLTAVHRTVSGANASGAVVTGRPPPPPPPPPSARRRLNPRRRLPGESRREMRRRIGVSRRITLRVVIFFVLVVALFGGAYAFIRWYANSNWYVTTQGKHLVVYQGRAGSILWFHPKLVYRSPVTTKTVLSDQVGALRADVNEPSLSAAKKYISNLFGEYLTTVSTTTTTTTTTKGGVTTTSGTATTTTTAP